MDKEVEQLLRKRVRVYRRLLIIVGVANLGLTCFGIFLGFAILTAHSEVKSLELSTQSISRNLTHIEAQSDLAHKRINAIDSGTKPLSETVTQILNTYAGVERCNLDELPPPTSEFDVAVYFYFDKTTYAGLRTDIPSVKQIEEEMYKKATLWSNSRPAHAYIEFANNLQSEMLLEILSRPDQAGAARFTIEKEAVFVACLRQIGLIDDGKGSYRVYRQN